jgi:uncharacterized protein (TIGR02646 family)
MRPIDRGPAPKDYDDYREAKQDLANRLGCYCCFCERRIATCLAVEHLAPQSKYPDLVNQWHNFLLACVNCNSVKSIRDWPFDQVLLPDRDNTFAAFSYSETGWINVAPTLAPEQAQMAQATLEWVGLNRHAAPDWDEAQLFSALERLSQRVQVWAQARDARVDFERGRVSPGRIASEAASAGFFSIWMAVFAGVAEVRQAIIAIFPNTARDCFDSETDPISPRPANTLPHSGKV